MFKLAVNNIMKSNSEKGITKKIAHVTDMNQA